MKRGILRTVSSLLLLLTYGIGGVGGYGLHLVGDFHHHHAGADCADDAHNCDGHEHALAAGPAGRRHTDEPAGPAVAASSGEGDLGHICPICQWHSQGAGIVALSEAPAVVTNTPHFVAGESQSPILAVASAYRSRAPPGALSQLG